MTTTGDHLALKRSENSEPQKQAYAAPILPVAEESLIGEVLDKRFKILSRIGKGGMSEVYKAQHLLLQKPLAIKVLHAQEACKKNSIERFQQEARAISTLDHPNIVRVYAFGLSDTNRLYLAMDFLDGPSLEEILLAVERLEWPRAVTLALQVANGLEQAHSRGIIHRDLKPSNIIVQTNEHGVESVKVVDFGIARLTSDSGKQVKELTLQGNTCGSPPYMSPEQCMGEKVDARSDIYSFGCMLFELLTGRRPFEEESPLKVMQMQVEKSPPSFATVSPSLDIPPELEAVVRKCMDKTPEFRYQNMVELQADLQTIVSGPTSINRKQTSEPKQIRAGQTRKSLAIAAALLFCILSGSTFAYFKYFGNSELSKIDSEIAGVRDRNIRERVNKKLLLVGKLINFESNKANGQEPAPSDREIVMHRLHELQTEISSMPSGLDKCFAQSNLMNLYTKAGKQSDAKELGNQALSSLEQFVAEETAKNSPNKNAIEIALLESLRLCKLDPEKEDRMLGKYNILLSICMAEKRYEQAERCVNAELALVKAKIPPSALAEISVRQNLACVLTAEGKLPAAESALKQAWDICKKGWTPDCAFSKNLASALASCYRAEGKEKEADEVLKETIEPIARSTTASSSSGR